MTNQLRLALNHQTAKIKDEEDETGEKLRLALNHQTAKIRHRPLDTNQ